jgi:hypothetical protein
MVPKSKPLQTVNMTIDRSESYVQLIKACHNPPARVIQVRRRRLGAQKEIHSRQARLTRLPHTRLNAIPSCPHLFVDSTGFVHFRE